MASGAVSMPMFDSGVFLGRVEVFMQGCPGEKNPFPEKEIRLSRRSPASDRCPPLAVLQVISPYAMRCKLRAQPNVPPGSRLHALYFTCFKERLTAVVEAGGEELHLVAMQSKVKGDVPSFWCWSARSGLYSACLDMLNQHRLAVVFDLDETLVVSKSTKSFPNRKGRDVSTLMNLEVGKVKESAMLNESSKLSQDKHLLEEFAHTGCITVDGRIVQSQKEEVILSRPGCQQHIVRSFIRIPGRNVVLTRINPKEPVSSILVNIRPCWDYLKSYLTENGGQRFKVYVCTMAGRGYALEIWRLLDPEGSLISFEDLSERLICVKPGKKSEKSLQRVFQEHLCHPSMAMVIDDRLDVWEEKDKRRVHVVRAYNPSFAPEDKVVSSGRHVLQILRSVICNVHSGYFREFDGNFLKKIDELMYENKVLDLPYTPDVVDYLVPKGNYIVRHSDAPLPAEDTRGAEVEGTQGSLNRQHVPVGSSNGADH